MPSPRAANGIGAFQVASHPPIDRIDFAELPELHVVGLDIHMKDAFAMGKGNRIAELIEYLEIFIDRVVTNLLFPRVPLDVLHRIKANPFLGAPEFIDRGDIRML